MDKIHIYPHEPSVERGYKESHFKQKGIVYWFTGLSGSGKSTISREFERKLNSLGIMTVSLDGDNLRSGLCSGLGFSPEDRRENLRRVAEVCKVNAQNGIVVLASFISPFMNDREMVKDIVGEDYVEVFVNTPLEICESRDVKGLYRKARLGEITNFTGISSPYEYPESPAIVVEGKDENIYSCISELVNHYSERLLKSTSKRIISDWSLVNHGNNPMNLTENQHAVFIGRFQPLHEGHIRLFRQKLDQGVPLLILVRDLVPDNNNPFTTEQTIEMIERVFKGQKVTAMKIPDIESVNWGRGVGYELNEYFPPENIGSISATQVRKLIGEGSDEWRRFIDTNIQEYILDALGLTKVA